MTQLHNIHPWVSPIGLEKRLLGLPAKPAE